MRWGSRGGKGEKVATFPPLARSHVVLHGAAGTHRHLDREPCLWHVMCAHHRGLLRCAPRAPMWHAAPAGGCNFDVRIPVAKFSGSDRALLRQSWRAARHLRVEGRGAATCCTCSARAAAPIRAHVPDRHTEKQPPRPRCARWHCHRAASPSRASRRAAAQPPASPVDNADLDADITSPPRRAAYARAHRAKTAAQRPQGEFGLSSPAGGELARRGPPQRPTVR